MTSVTPVRFSGTALALALGLAACGGSEQKPATWQGAIEADAVAKCATSGCHLAPAPATMYKLTPGQANSAANYMATKMFINTAAADQSTLLTKPANKVMHTGGPVQGFDIPNGAFYKKWLAWIQAGAPEK